ncbi:MAG: aminoglycoside phosphotransferase family protein [Caulobacterales bacterium]
MPRMHVDEIDTNPGLVKKLLTAQFPHWANLPIRRIATSGSDHAIYRLGDSISARFPLIGWAQSQPEKEHFWLPILAPNLPIDVPKSLGLGSPGEGYPFHWAIHSWLPGANPIPCDDSMLARDVAALVCTLRTLDIQGEPPPQSAPALHQRDAFIRKSLARFGGSADTTAVTAAWESALAASATWDGALDWVHGDLGPGNLLVRDGRLCGLIDFGSFGRADQAIDLRIAWSLFRGRARQVFREALDIGDDAWARARGYALAQAIAALPYYLTTNPGIVAISRATLAEVLAEQAGG